jgi:cytochrome c peroxidase
MRLTPHPAEISAPLSNPGTPAKIALGRLLFFDPILSASRDVSCATCHHPGWAWADGRPTPIGTGGTGLGPDRVPTDAAAIPLLRRNTPSLLNVGFNGVVAGSTGNTVPAPMFWDSRVEGLEAQAIVPLQTPGEMCGTECNGPKALTETLTRIRSIPAYCDAFGTAFGSTDGDAISAEHLAQALAAFERTLVTPPTPVDRFLSGDTQALSPLQQDGLRVFQSAGCLHCHGGPLFSDFKLHALGVPDHGPGGQQPFRTPTLRNLGHTAPYMHDGSLRTIRDVLEFYDDLAEAVSETLDGGAPGGGAPLDPLLRHLDLKPDDFPALEAFLEALTSKDFDRSIPSTVPSGLRVVTKSASSPRR